MSFDVIGVVALARHGKDTLANAIIDAGFYRCSFADKLKLEVAEMYPDEPAFQVRFDEQGRLHYVVPEEEIPPRILYLRRTTWQVWGTEGRRDVFSDYWIWQWCFRCIKIATEGRFKGVVVADVRFPNEFEFIQKDCGGRIVAADRGNYRCPNTDYTHRSEIHVPGLVRKADFVVPNLGTFEDYKRNVNNALNHLGLAS